MAIKIPPDAKIVRDQRIDTLRLIATLHDRFIEGPNGCKAKIKATMQDKGAEFAEGDFTRAALRPGNPKSIVDPEKLYELVKRRQLSMDAFLSCVTVQRKPLEAFLGSQVIYLISSPGPTPEPALYSEFKEGVEVDFDVLAKRLSDAFKTATAVQ